ncbi:MAG: hypothetical protein ACI8QZ_002650 [Chlamydiales bacterium]|jgi:hypothetical protein
MGPDDFFNSPLDLHWIQLTASPPRPTNTGNRNVR